MDPQLLTYYEAIEKASADMLSAAREGNWDEVVKLEGACVLLISQLKHAAQEHTTGPQTLAQAGEAAGGTPADGAPSAALQAVPQLDPQLDPQEAARRKSRIMQRILVNDAEIRHLAEPWLQDLNDSLAARKRTLH
jgi:flagellar protein FliT